MRTSHLALAGALCFLVLVIVAQAATTRYVLARADAFTEEARTPAARITRDIELEDFTSVRAQGRWEITLTRGPEFAVQVNHPEDMSDLVEVDVSGGELMLVYRAPRGLRMLGIGLGSAGSARATVVMPTLDQIYLEGGSTTALTGFEGDRLRILGFGAHRVEGQDSRYDSLELTLNGAGEARLRGVRLTDAHLSLAGATDVTLTMDGGVLSGSVAGAGRVIYHGTVREQTVSVAGAARVEPAD